MSVLISEIGINHLGDVAKLTRMIEKAAAYGLPSVKFQYRSYGTEFFDSALEMGSTLLAQELSKVNLDRSTIQDSCLLARKLGLSVGVSFFRIEDLHDFCANFLPDYIKIPSAEAINFELIRAAQIYGVPVMVSTGGQTLLQLERLATEVTFLSDDVVLYCVANYPAALGSTLPAMIAQYRALFPCKIGYSSHDENWEVNIAFLHVGIDFLERHLCEDKSDRGLDISTSSDFDEMAKLNMFCRNQEWCRQVNISDKAPNQGEIQNLRDLGSGYYYKRDYSKGDRVLVADLEVKSPCRGVRVGSISEVDLIDSVYAGSPVLDEDFIFKCKSIKLRIEDLIKNRISLPVRFHDYKKIMSTFALHNFEFHMSYRDVEKILELQNDLSQNLSTEHEFSIHLPDYVSSRALIDPFSSEASVRVQSRYIIEGCVKFARFLEDFTGKKCPIIGSFSAIGTRQKTEFYNGYRDLIGEIMERDKVTIAPQFLPKKAWYFGGSCELNVFCSLDDLEFYREMPGGLCLDTAHCIMAANFAGASKSLWLQTLLPLATHVHVSDAQGDDGEGVKFGDGELGDDVQIVLAHKSVKVIEQWEGHLYNFRGFEQALAFLGERV